MKNAGGMAIFKEIKQQMEQQEKSQKEEEAYLKKIELQQARDEKKKLKKQTKVHKKQNRLEALKHLIECAPGSSWESSLFEKEMKMFEKLEHEHFSESQLLEKRFSKHCPEETTSVEKKERTGEIRNDTKGYDMEKKKTSHKKFTNLSQVKEVESNIDIPEQFDKESEESELEKGFPKHCPEETTSVESNIDITEEFEKESEESEEEDHTCTLAEEKIECDQSLLHKHLTMYEDLMKIQPKRHTEKQLLMETLQKKENHMNAEKLELARLRAQKKREFEEMKKACKKDGSSLTLNKALMDCPQDGSTSFKPTQSSSNGVDDDRKRHASKVDDASSNSTPIKESCFSTHVAEEICKNEPVRSEKSLAKITNLENYFNQEEIKTYRPPPPPGDTLFISRIEHLAV